VCKTAFAVDMWVDFSLVVATAAAAAVTIERRDYAGIISRQLQDRLQ